MAKSRDDYFNAGSDLGRTIVNFEGLQQALDPAKSWQAKAFNDGLRTGYEIGCSLREKEALAAEQKVDAGFKPENNIVCTQYAREEYMPHATVEHVKALERRLGSAHGKLAVRLAEKVSALETKYAKRFVENGCLN
jgi:hypothetical protein